MANHWKTPYRTGVLPLAAGESMAGKWIQAQLAARLVDKEYLCLCAPFENWKFRWNRLEDLKGGEKTSLVFWCRHFPISSWKYGRAWSLVF